MATPRLLNDRYEIVRRLRVGRVTQVYEGIDRHDEQPVAIELLRDVLGTDKAVTGRFRQASRTAAKLVHPNIVKLKATSEAQGVGFVVRELVEDQCLRDLVSSQAQLEPARAAAIAIEVCEALDFAHQRGICHGCLTPSDILLTGDGHVKLVGFGVATSIGTVDAIDVRYRAPEQARQVGDRRADLYALGCCVYEMLLGRPPFHGDPQLNDRLAARAPAELATITGRLLAEQVADRYQKASEVRDELNRYWTKVAPPSDQPSQPSRTAAVRVRDSAILVGSFLLVAGGVAAATQVDLGSEQVVTGDDEPQSHVAGKDSRPTGAGATRSGPGEWATGDTFDDEHDNPEDDEELDEEKQEDLEEDGESGDDETPDTTETSTVGDTPPRPGTSTTEPPSVTTTSAPTSQPPASTVPNVVGMTEGQAGNTLASHDLGMATHRVRVSNQSQDGRVISQSPGGGSSRPSNGTVTVQVGYWCFLIC